MTNRSHSKDASMQRGDPSKDSNHLHRRSGNLTGMTSQPQNPKLAEPIFSPKAIRGSMAWFFLLLSALFCFLGVEYWKFATMNNFDRSNSRKIILEQPLPIFSEQRVMGEYLTGCVNIMSHWTFAIEPSSEQEKLSERCLKLAISQNKFDAQSSEGQLTQALANWLEGNEVAALSNIMTSRELAPRDLWNAMRRIELLLSIVPAEKLSDYDDYFSSEFKLLTATHLGVRTAVDLYAKYQVLRPSLLAISEEMSPENRLRFLNQLKRRVQG
mgnify:CR=1 FL=1